VRKNFGGQVRSSGTARGIIGQSRGGNQATHVVLKHPDQFSALGVFHNAMPALATQTYASLQDECWVMTIEGLETYILMPRDPADFDLLIEAMRPAPSPMDLDCVIGVRGPIAPPDACNGLMVPIVAFDQIYSFDRDALIKSIPKPEKTSAKDFAPVAEEVFDRIMQMADNAGATDEHRALNYLAVRYQAIYANAADAFGRNASLTSVDVVSSPLSGTRNVVDVIFSYTNRNTDVAEKFSVRVDVTEEFPFLVTKLSPYYGR
jgi:hypothetical protein